MWNWQKIDGIKNLPEFDRTVLLYEKKDNKKYAIIGWLSSIEKDGAHWSFHNSMDFFNIFGIKSSVNDDKRFKPSHWCDVEPPVDENPK
jgi:hypothetical protein